jgi:hypothetical protein
MKVSQLVDEGKALSYVGFGFIDVSMLCPGKDTKAISYAASWRWNMRPRRRTHTTGEG